jgi:hypothetical protein
VPRTAVGSDEMDDPLEQLRALAARRAEQRAELDRLERTLVLRARIAGATWTQVGAALGHSAQAAHRKHRRDAR